MKKLLIVLVVAFSTQFSFAQDKGFRADVKKMIELTGANAQIQTAKEQVIGLIPEDKHEAFTKEFNESLKPVLKKQEDFYLKNYTQDEVKQIIKFYESPIGKKMALKTSEQIEATLPEIQNWSMELQGLIMKYQE